MEFRAIGPPTVRLRREYEELPEPEAVEPKGDDNASNRAGGGGRASRSDKDR